MSKVFIQDDSTTYDIKFANELSPTDWDTYKGQEKVKERLKMQIQAALKRNEQLGHSLILGPSGSGKTSLARLIAQEHNRPFKDLMITPGFAIKKLWNILMEFDIEEGGGIVFLDEVHNFSKKEQHYLYSVIEEDRIAMDNATSYYFENPITIIGATTDERDLQEALRGRFGAPYRLADYTDIEMAQIVERMARNLDLNPPSREVCYELGKASAGSPRQAAGLVKMARDLDNNMDPKSIFVMAEITPDGLTADHVKYLETMKAVGGRAGLEVLSNHSFLAKDDLIKLERLLMKKEFILMTGKGREITSRGLYALTKAQELFNG